MRNGNRRKDSRKGHRLGTMGKESKIDRQEKQEEARQRVSLIPYQFYANTKKHKPPDIGASRAIKESYLLDSCGLIDELEILHLQAFGCSKFKTTFWVQ